jgi:hypothetical protein
MRGIDRNVESQDTATTQSLAARSRRPRARRLGLALALVLGVWMALGQGAATAAIVHPFLGSFDGSDTPRGSLGVVVAAAADNSAGPSAGDFYLGGGADIGQPSAVQKFAADGSYAGVEFDGADTPQSSFELISWTTFARGGIAVDGSSGANAGDVYVADVAHNVVDRFSESGEFLCQITGTTPVTSEQEAAECAGAAGSETPSGGLGLTTGVGVNPVNGHVYVTDATNLVIHEFSEAGGYLGQIADSHLTQPGPLAFDSNGNLYVANGSLLAAENVVKFDSSGTFVEVLDGSSGASYVAVDPGIDHAYVYRASPPTEILEYGASGALLVGFAEGKSENGSLAASASTGNVYLAQAFGEAFIYGAGVVVPEVTTTAATEIGETSATLNGEAAPDTVNAGGDVTACEFEYVQDSEYQPGTVNPYAAGGTVPCEPAVPYSSPTPVSAVANGLTPNTLYHYRLAAADAEGTGAGEDRTFITSGPPTVANEHSTARTSSAIVRADIDPHGYETTCEVEVVDEATYQASGFGEAASVPCPEPLAAGNGDRTVRVELPGLTIGTVYHYRFVVRSGATSGGGLVFGEDRTFATFKVEDLTVEVKDEAGEPFTQAGGHPYEMRVSFDFNLTEPGIERIPSEKNAAGNIRNVKVQLPPGLIGNPTAVPKCSPGDLKRRSCPIQARVGRMDVRSAQLDNGVLEYGDIYNLQAPRGIAAEFGAQLSAFPSVRMDFGVRTGSDYGIDSIVVAVNADTGVSGVEVRIKGVPGNFTGVEPVRPLLSNPTSCAGPLHVNLAADTWQEPGVFVEADEELPAITGCNQVQFEPSLEARPTTNVADAPTGLDVDLHVPQNEDLAGLRTADLRKATVTLPEGITLNPAGANGLAACAPGEFDIHGSAAANCPDASKVGTIEVDTPLVDHPLPGSVFVARPFDNPFGSLVALYLGVHDPETGVVIKLAGKVEIDPQTGRLSSTFDENPQLPFEHLRLHFFGGAKAPLRTPATCGTYRTTSSLTPWSAPESGPPATPSDSYLIDQAPGGGSCPRSEAEQPHAPSFEAGTVTPIAGIYSPFVLRLHREDGSQQIAKLTVTPPPGLLAKLAGTSYCPEGALASAAQKSGAAELAFPSCPDSSRVGTVEVAAGAGPAPYRVKGTAYLAGPYQGAPLSLAIVTPAVAGPFDLGSVVVRSALHVDPETTQITVKSDPIPRILQGIPLDIRTISMQIDRPSFTRNPTSCDPSTVSAQAISLLGQPSLLSRRFQLGNCGALAFKPKLALRLKGGTRRTQNPALRATLTMPDGNADIAGAQVTLPRSEFLDQSHIRTVCTRVRFAADTCPARSVYGAARAWSPLLDQPLKGPVYLRSNGGDRQLPDLVADLEGQIPVVLVGYIDSKKGGLRTTFARVPDAPVSKFVLDMQGGKKGLLENSTNICRSPQRAKARFAGHNGKVFESAPVLQVRCPKGKSGKGRR